MEKRSRKAERKLDRDDAVMFVEEFERDWGFGGPENPMQFHGVAEKYLYVDDPYIKSKALFAIDEKNKELDIDKQLSLAKIDSVYKHPIGDGMVFWISLKANELCGKEITCRAYVYSCFFEPECNILGEFSVAPYGKNAYEANKKKQAASAPPKLTKEFFVELRRRIQEKGAKGDEKLKMYHALLDELEMQQAPDNHVQRDEITEKENSNVSDQEDGYIKIYPTDWCKHMNRPPWRYHGSQEDYGSQED